MPYVLFALDPMIPTGRCRHCATLPSNQRRLRAALSGRLSPDRMPTPTKGL